MSPSDDTFDFVHLVPGSFPGIEYDVWEHAARVSLAAMLVTVHRAGARITHAEFQGSRRTLNPHRSSMQTMILPEPLFARMVAAGHQAHTEFLQARSVEKSVVRRAWELYEKDLDDVLSRLSISIGMDGARREAALIVRDDLDLIHKVVAHLGQARSVTGSHLAALADPTRPDPTPGAPALTRANTDWSAPHIDVTVLAALPTTELERTVEALLPTLAAHADLVSPVPAHQVHWPLVWGEGLSDEATQTLVDALKPGAYTAGPVPAVGRLMLLPASHPCEVVLDLHRIRNGPGFRRLQKLPFEVSSPARLDPRSRTFPTGTSEMALARCHTPGLADGLMESLGTVTATVQLHKLAVLRLRYDDHATISRWQVVHEVDL